MRTADGAWTPPTTLGKTAGGADAAIAPDGRAVVTWSAPTSDGDGEIVLARSRAAGGWSAPTVLGPGTAPRIDVNASGSALVAWAAPDETTGSRLRAITARPASLGPPSTLPTSGEFGPIEHHRSSRVAMSASGRGFVAWADPAGPGVTTGAAAISTAGSVQRLRSRGDGDRELALAADAAGNAVVLYRQATATGAALFASSFAERR